MRTAMHYTNATALVGLSHRGSRLETPAAAAMRQPYGVFAVVEKRNGTERVHYILKDHLGSWTMITDARGNIEQEVSFDAWGNMRDPDTWTGTVTQQPMFDRGFTGHEHLNSFGLINMNGRMYDPVMSSFLSVDNYVQQPDNSQNFNRYAYCMNNPLKYTDPDGEWAHLLIGALVGGAVNLGINAIQNNIHSVGEGIGYFAIGALAGGLSAGIGAGVGAAYVGGSFAAGFFGTTVQAAPCALGFAGGFSVGFSSGFVSASITVSGNRWMQNGTFSEGILAGMTYGFASGLIGGFAYGTVGAVCAGVSGKNWFDASMDYDINLVNRRMPKITQSTDKNCVGAVVESCSAKDGTGISQEQIRTMMGVDSSRGLEDLTAMKTYVESVGDVQYQISGEFDNTRGMVVPESSLDRMLNPDTHTWINLNQDNGHEVVLNRVYKTVHISPQGKMTVSQWNYEVMDPWIGGYRNISLDQIRGSQNILYLKLIR